jgi:hypothetical protein
MVVGEMEISRALELNQSAGEVCPRCDEPEAGLGPVRAQTLGGVPLHRCHRCGTRVVREDDRERFVFSCGSCGLPFLAEEILPHAEHRCDDCRSGKEVLEVPEDVLTGAMEEEARSALSLRWSFVTSPSLTIYLQRVVNQLESRIPGAPAGCRVVLVDVWSMRTLALPSGLIMISLGTLAFLEDEAELAFVLGHEIAHAASGDAAIRLVRLGYHAVASERIGGVDDVWTETVLDLVRLGYGRVRERDADAVALEALLSLGYDPVSVGRYLARIQKRIGAGDSELSELAAAHPPADDRSRRIDRVLFGRSQRELAPKTNREVFRRAAGHHVLAGDLVPVDLTIRSEPEDGDLTADTAGKGRLFWMVAVIATLTAIILSVGLYLSN